MIPPCGTFIENCSPCCNRRPTRPSAASASTATPNKLPMKHKKAGLVTADTEFKPLEKEIKINRLK
jgi:hypothetical protein